MPDLSDDTEDTIPAALVIACAIIALFLFGAALAAIYEVTP